MQGVLNAQEFLNPRRRDRWYRRAEGWTPDGMSHEGGIWKPLEVKLRRGTTLFRIGHSRSPRGPLPDAVNLSSFWWMESQTFAEIAVSSDIIGADRQYLARLKLSVSERFGVFDTMFCVVLVGALGALRGTGNPVYDTENAAPGTPPPAWAYPGNPVTQCFIPGLRDLHGRPTDLAERAFRLVGRHPISAWRRLDAGRFANLV